VWSRNKDVEVLTGFGQLQDATKQHDCRLTFNYAPALDGTLIGLRLMQADIVLTPGYGDLFKLDGKYVLGTGETAPSARELAARERKQGELAQKLPRMRSYILTDADQRMTFALSKDRVVFSGSPVYRLWKITAEDWGRWKEDLSRVSTTEFGWRALVAEQTLLERLGGESLELDFEVLTPDDVVGFTRVARTLRGTDLGRNALLTLEDWVRQTTVVLIPADQNPLADPKTIEALNPIVYRAVTQFAQLAAWFRYVQASHPAAWAAFIRQLPATSITQPRVQLPTCIPQP
jgi:hypothetical protein